MSPRDLDPMKLAEQHRNKLFSLIELVLTKAGHAYDRELEEYLDEIVKSFDEYAGATNDPPLPCVEDGLDMGYRGHNFVTAQCSALMVFATQVAAIAQREQHAELQRLMAFLREKLERLYDRFFDRVPPWAGAISQK